MFLLVIFVEPTLPTGKYNGTSLKIGLRDICRALKGLPIRHDRRGVFLITKDPTAIFDTEILRE